MNRWRLSQLPASVGNGPVAATVLEDDAEAAAHVEVEHVTLNPLVGKAETGQQ